MLLLPMSADRLGMLFHHFVAQQNLLLPIQTTHHMKMMTNYLEKIIKANKFALNLILLPINRLLTTNNCYKLSKNRRNPSHCRNTNSLCVVRRSRKEYSDCVHIIQLCSKSSDSNKSENRTQIKLSIIEMSKLLDLNIRLFRRLWTDNLTFNKIGE